MLKIASAISIAIALLCAAVASRPETCASPAAAPTTILIVRHADRIPKEDALSPAGIMRAKELVHAVGHSGVAAVYCSKTVRARKTVEPVAESLKVAPIELDPNDAEGLIKKILADQRGKTVLVAGHSNTVPKIIAAAGGPKLADLADDDFDDLYVLTVGPEGSADVRLTTLQYGAATP